MMRARTWSVSRPSALLSVESLRTTGVGPPKAEDQLEARDVLLVRRDGDSEPNRAPRGDDGPQSTMSGSHLRSPTARGLRTRNADSPWFCMLRTNCGA